jgi:hypothetical protein
MKYVDVIVLLLAEQLDSILAVQPISGTALLVVKQVSSQAAVCRETLTSAAGVYTADTLCSVICAIHHAGHRSLEISAKCCKLCKVLLLPQASCVSWQKL